MKSNRKWLLLLLLVLLVFLGWKYLRSRGSDGDVTADRGREDPSLVLDRVWVDSKPEKYTDFVHALVMLDAVPMGMFQKASAYQLSLELFEFKRKDSKVGVLFPQTEKKARFSYKVESCNDLPPFDLCLTLSKNPWGGPKRYYGLRDSAAEAELLGDLKARFDAMPLPPAR